MAVSKILRYPNPFLRKQTQRVESPEKLDFSLIQDCLDTLRHSDDGVALAANQIGIDLRFFVLDVSRGHFEKHVPEIVFNPEIIEESSEKESAREGCLSFPGISVTVSRSKNVVVKFQHRDGSYDVTVAGGFGARVFQHEIDHLEGKLFVDQLPDRKKIEIVKAMEKR